MVSKVRLGVVGFGEFSISHLDIFIHHPDVEYVAGAEILPERRELIENQYGIKMYASFDEMLEKDPSLNSVAIFSQRHQHGPMIIQALKAGKNVFSAVPMGCSEEEVFEILELVKKTGLTFCMGETCYYFPCAVWARKFNKEGGFGDITYGEAQYYHDVTEMFASFSSAGPGYKRIAGIPPMFYGTHSASMLISVMNDFPTEVVCFGYTDKVGDDIYGVGKNDWDNPFSNEVALVRFKNGAIGRMNEFRRIGTVKPSSYITGIYGTKRAYECSGNQHLLSQGGVFGLERDSFDISDKINTCTFTRMKDSIPSRDGKLEYKYHVGFSPVQNAARLPAVFREMEKKASQKHDLTINGHNGSHYFCVDDFVRAVVENKIPPVNAWNAAIYTLVGIKAHESAIQGGVAMKIPDVGAYPVDKEVLDLD